jgi:hypothetical protein
VRGWYALFGIQPSHDIVYRCRAESGRHFETVLQLLPPGKTAPMVVQSLPITCNGPGTCAAVKAGRDLFLLSYDGPAEMACDQIRFHGTALLLTYDEAGRPARADMLDGQRLTIDGKEVVLPASPSPACSLDLR